MSNMSLNCGSLVAKKSQAGLMYFSGTVRLIGRLNGKLELLPHPNKGNSASEDHPEYEVHYQPAGDDASYAVGAGWMKNNPKVGDFVSITMGNPAWNDDLNLTVFPPNTTRNETTWRVVWSRPRGARVQDEQQAA
jgi:uncharacterized protein (DUF736 family)